MKTMRLVRWSFVAVALVGVFGIGAQRAEAIPILQLYMEGATYDQDTETWTLSPEGSSAGQPFKLWAVGNIDGPGGAGTIYNVRLSASYDVGLDLTITLTPTTTEGYMGFTDNNEAPAIEAHNGPTEIDTSDPSTLPQLGDGTTLPTHGELTDGKQWEEFVLGDFGDADDALITDFNDSLDSNTLYTGGQINAYLVTVTLNNGDSAHGVSVHFDLYDHVVAGNKSKYTFSPFSHDAEGTATIAPSPAAPLVGGICFALLGMMRPRRRQHD